MSIKALVVGGMLKGLFQFRIQKKGNLMAKVIGVFLHVWEFVLYAILLVRVYYIDISDFRGMWGDGNQPNCWRQQHQPFRVSLDGRIVF